MNGSIFVVNGGQVIELKEQKYENETVFQELIEKYPNILAGDQITPEEPRRWLFVSREMGVPSQQNGGTQWFLDHLFIDHEGIPTFIEVKRSTDTRIRREVVAQMLDYAANATEYWPAEMIRSLYEQQNRNMFDDIGIDRDKEESYWETVHTNLRSGKIRMLFVADEIPMSLKRIIEFLNGQMTEAEVLGVEIKRFSSDKDVSTLVPRVVGQTAESYTAKRRTSGQWDEESFLEEVERLNGDAAVVVCKKILRAFENMGCWIWWGKGAKHASCTVMYSGKEQHSLVSLYPLTRSTSVEIQFQYLKPPLDTYEKRKEIQHKLEEIDGVKIPDERLEKRPSFDWRLLQKNDSMEKFIRIYSSIISEINDYDRAGNHTTNEQ